MLEPYIFPDEALQILRKTRWRPWARINYDMWSGGFYWSDEFPKPAIDACISQNNWAYRFIIGYRASLIAGEPREGLRPAWDHLLRECPRWPGFRMSRRSSKWRGLQESENERILRELDAIDNELDRQ